MASLIEPIKIKKEQKITQLIINFLKNAKINNKKFGDEVF